MRFSSALFASLAAQAAVAGLLPSIPSTTGIKSLDTGLSVVHSVRGSVEAEGEAVALFVEQGLIPLAKTSLGVIAQQVQSIEKTIKPYLLSIILPLSESQLSNVLALLTNTKDLITGIKGLITKLLDETHDESRKAIAAELQVIVQSLKPVVVPIITLCKALAGTGTSGTSKQIAIAVDNLKEAADSSAEHLQLLSACRVARSRGFLIAYSPIIHHVVP